MKGMIDEEGFLHIERAGKMKAQACCQGRTISVLDVSAPGPCGDNCPRFGEPILCYSDVDGLKEENWHVIPICNGEIVSFSPGCFEDKRPTA